MCTVSGVCGPLLKTHPACNHQTIFSQVGVPNFGSILQMQLHDFKIKFADTAR